MRRNSIILIFFATTCGIGGLAQAPGSPERAGVARTGVEVPGSPERAGVARTGVEVPATAGPERGTLVLIGGGAQLIADSPNPVLMHKFVHKFVQLVGGAGARIVFIPTGAPDDLLTPEALEHMRVRLQEVMGVDHVTVMHTRDRKQADSAEFVAPLRQATGVWIGSGKDAYLLDAYLGTRVETEIKALLARGGVVAGNSAGAAISGSLDLQGTMVDSPGSPGGKILHVDGTRPAWGLLANSVVEPHWSQRNRPDLTPVVASQPDSLAIGIDQEAAAVVQGNRLEVFGEGHVGIYDGKVHGNKPYYDLSPGDRFDLHTRSSIPIN